MSLDDVSYASLKEQIKALLAGNRIDEATQVLERDLWPSAAPPEDKSRLLAAVLSQMPPDGAAPLLERLRARGDADAVIDSNPKIMFRAAMADYRSGLLKQALDRLDRGARAGDLSPMAEALRADILNRLGRTAEAVTAAIKALDNGLDRSSHIVRLARLLLREGRGREAAAHLEDALRRWPTDETLLKGVNRLLAPPALLAPLYDVARANFHEQALSDRALEELLRLALQMADDETVEKIFARIPSGASALKPLGHDLPPLSTRLLDDLSRQVQTVARPGAVATLVVFPGLRNRFAGLPFHYADSLFEALPVNLIYLRDVANRCFLQGISDLGEGQQETAAGIKRLAATLGAERLVMLGVSIGGFAALRYGALAGASAVLSFSGPTKLYSLIDKPSDAPAVFARWEMGEFGDRTRDVLPDVAASPAMRAILVAGETNEEDVRQARRLEALPNVAIHLMSGVDVHAELPLAAVASGEFHIFLNEALGLDEALGPLDRP